jgi:Fic family protein
MARKDLMMTLRQIESGEIGKHIPMSVTWYLSDIGVAMGKQELFTRQAPQRLKVLREHAIAESAISSNRIEGVEIDQSRVGTVIFGRPDLLDRNEQEVGGYRDALNLIHTEAAELPVSEETILRLHKMSRGEIWDAGKYKDQPVDIIEKLPDGRQRVRFRTVSPEKTPEFIREMLRSWDGEYRDHRISPLIAFAALNLDFLCIHPFRDGNGRVSRLLLLLTCYLVGIEVGRYISLERVIEENKERYYETLQQSSQGWHEGTHDPWPYIGYLLFIIKKAYGEFGQRAGAVIAPRGEKSELVLQAIRTHVGGFRLVDIEKECPGIGRDWIRAILFGLKEKGMVMCSGKGKAARWRYAGD